MSALAAKVEKIAEVFEKESAQAKSSKKTVAKKKPGPKTVKKKATPKKKVAIKKKEAPKESEMAAEVKETESTAETGEQLSESGNILDSVYGLISSEGTTVSELKEKTGFAPRQINNALYKLKQSGKIESLSRGVYVKREL